MGLLVLQETKMSRFSIQVARRLWDRRNFGYNHKNAEGRSRGILVAWNKNLIDVSEVRIRSFSISIKCHISICSFD